MDKARPKLCFLDDNFLSYPKWEEILQPVIDSGKRFQFKQGLDERLLTVDKVLKISKWKYDGDMIFAFDNIDDKELISKKLRLVRTTVPNWKRTIKFYVFCGADKGEKYDDEFWRQDIKNLFERIHILSMYGCIPYVMRFEEVYKSKYASFYATVAAWCNQPAWFKTTTFRMFCKIRGMRKNGYSIYKRDIDSYMSNIGIKGKSWVAMEDIEENFPEIADCYFDFVGKPESCFWLNNM